eukprot:gene8519-343_t
MSKYSNKALLFGIGIIFHLIYLYSIFDIYFKSPIIHGMPNYQIKQPGISKRIVYIVSDGLRSDKLYNNINQFPFFKSIINGNSNHGISHTRVPTESRPCHVSMISGFYEDVSAVFNGWKVNPVKFDSVFNQSNFVLQIGSPDVVQIYKGDNMESHFYKEEMEDFSRDPKELDEWVFKKFNKLKNHKKLKQEKVFLFLHLLGMDSAGHSFKPNSPEYIEGIKYLDLEISKLYKTIEEMFPDKKTTYIFTSDHGMTDRGSHGSGELDCTRTPFILWGNGVLKSNIDIQQVDMAPIFASFLGIPYPSNNIGKLPIQLINSTESYKIENLCVNAKQIFSQLERRKELKKLSFFHSNFYLNWDDSIELDLKNERYSLVKNKCDKMISESLKGLEYYQKYDWPLLMTIITCGYFGWIITSLNQSFHFDKYSIFVYISFSIYFFIQKFPILYYIYILFPILFLRKIPLNFEFLNISNLFILESIVGGYFYREIFSLLFLYFSISKRSILISFLSIFTILPLDLTDNRLVFLGGILLILFIKNKNSIILFQKLLIILSILIVYFTDKSLELKQGSPLVLYSWILFFSSFLMSIFVNEIESICLGFSIPLILLSVSYEVIYFFILSMILLKEIDYKSKDCSLQFIMLIHVSFFGCGNLASISSFQLSSVYRFVTIFSPFLMAILLILKVIIPMLLVVIFFHSFKKNQNFWFEILGLSDFMTLNLFYLVKDQVDFV